LADEPAATVLPKAHRTAPKPGICESAEGAIIPLVRDKPRVHFSVFNFKIDTFVGDLEGLMGLNVNQ